MERKLYLDNAATTRVDDEVAKKVLTVFTEDYGNASSQYEFGQRIRKEIDSAREKIAKFIGVDAKEIIFTSGGTESNNLALKGLLLRSPSKKHIITSSIEHPSVLETCRFLEDSGYEVDYVGVDSGGIVNVDEIKKKIREDTLVVSIMHVNNEIGTIQPIEEIGNLCKEKKIYFHSDCVQSLMKLDLDFSKMNVDLASFSGHKVNAPKGIGFLYVKSGTKISPLIHGGGQENGLRSGTDNSPGIIGLVGALNVNVDKEKIEKIRDKIIEGLLKIPKTKINGSLDKRVYHNIHVSFYGIEGEGLMLMLDGDGIMVSTGSACSSTKLNESHVLKAMGVDEMYVHGSLRLTLGEIEMKDVDYIVEKITERVSRLRDMSPFKLDIGDDPVGNSGEL